MAGATGRGSDGQRTDPATTRSKAGTGTESGPGPGTTGTPNRTESSETVSAPVTAIATILATLAGAGVLAVGLGVLVPGIVAAIAGGLLTATVTATKGRTPGGRAVGSVLTVVAAIGIAAAVGLAAVGGLGASMIGIASRVGVVLAIGIAAFGATATVTGAIGDRAVRSAIPVASLTSLPIGIVAVFHIEPVRARLAAVATAGPLGDSSDGGIGLNRVLEPESLLGSGVSFVVLVVGLLWLTYILLPKLPIPELVPRDRRDETRRRIDRLASRSARAGTLLIVGSGVAAILAVPAQNDDLRYAEDVDPVALFETYLSPITMATELRIGILAAAGVLIALYLLSKLPGVHRLRYSSTVRWLPVFTGGTIVALLVWLGYPQAFDRWIRPELEASVAEGTSIAVPGLGEELLASDLLTVLAPPNGIALVGVVLASVVGSVLGVFVAIWLTGSLKLLPDRGAPGSLGAAALIVGAIVAGIDGASALVVAGAVACAIVSWDAAVYGVSITEELGRDGGGRRPALAHTIGAVLVGGVGIGVAIGLNRLARSVTVQTGVTIAISLTVALLVSFVVIKRHASATAAATATTAAGPRDDGSAATPAAIDATTTDPDAPVDVDAVPVLDVHEARMLQAADFETVGDLQAASEDELAAVTGVKETTAAAVTEAVGDPTPDESSDDESEAEAESEASDDA